MSIFMQQHNVCDHEKVDVIKIFGDKTKIWIQGDQAGGSLG